MKYRINYSKVISQANSIAGDASELSAQIRILEQMEQDCRSAWKGQAADAFIAKLSVLRTEMNRTKNRPDCIYNSRGGVLSSAPKNTALIFGLRAKA